MAEDSMDSGRTTRWKVKAHLHGLMEGDTKESMSMTRKKARVHSTGQTVENMRAVGPTESSTALEFIPLLQARQRKENGLMERELLGSTEMKFWMCDT
jgi:hypothetical protein